MSQLPDRFQTGYAYFIVTFVDEALTIPIVQTLIFDKTGKRSNGKNYYLFREALSDGQEQRFVVDEDQADELVLDQEKLLQKLSDSFQGKLSFSPWNS